MGIHTRGDAAGEMGNSFIVLERCVSKLTATTDADWLANQLNLFTF